MVHNVLRVQVDQGLCDLQDYSFNHLHIKLLVQLAEVLVQIAAVTQLNQYVELLLFSTVLLRLLSDEIQVLYYARMVE